MVRLINSISESNKATDKGLAKTGAMLGSMFELTVLLEMLMMFWKSLPF